MVHTRRLQIMVLLGLIGLLALLLGPRIAAQETIQVMIHRVDSTAFPQVSIYVSVLNAQGVPLIGLTGEHMALQEDGQPIPADGLAVEAAHVPRLGLVLVMDLSTPSAWLEQSRSAAIGLIEDQLGPEDMVALVVVGDQARLVVEPGADRAALRDALDSLQPEGSFTALNEGLAVAADLLQDLPVDRRAIIVLADTPDNTGKRPVAPAVTDIPVHVIGYGTKGAQASALADLARATGGQFWGVWQPEQLDPRLQTLGVLLRQGYRVTFHSRLPADGAEHELSLQVQAGETTTGAGNGSARFKAVSGLVTVVPVIGTITVDAAAQAQDGVRASIPEQIHLSAHVTAPAPIASVTYLIDGQVLARVEQMPFAAVWDTAGAAPGAHTLTVVVADSAGNQGQSQTEIELSVPLIVRLKPLAERVSLEEKVTVEAEVEAEDGVALVELLADGRPLSQLTASPFLFEWDTMGATPGEHILAVRATDLTGRRSQAETSLSLVQPVQVLIDLARPEVQRGQAVTVTAAVDALDKIAQVEYMVDGQPVPGRDQPPYQFIVDSTGAEVGAHLVTVRVVDAAGHESTARAVLHVFAPPLTPWQRWVNLWWYRLLSIAALFVDVCLIVVLLVLIVRRRQQKLYQRCTLEISNAGNVPGHYELRAQDPRRALAFLVSFDGRLESARLLGPTPQPERGQGRHKNAPAPALGQGRAGGAQAQPSSVARTVQETGSRIRGLSDVVNNLGMLLGGASGAKLRGVSQQTNATITESNRRVGYAQRLGRQLHAPVSVPAAGVERPLPVQAPPPALPWLQTPVVAPGETLTVDLFVGPVRRFPVQEHLFQVFSRPVPVDSGLQEELLPMTQEGRIRVGSASWFHLYAPAGLFLALAAAVHVLVLFLVLGAGLFKG